MDRIATKKADLRITNAKVLINDQLLELGLAIQNQRILKIGKEPELPAAEQNIDARGKLILPGAVDAHVHLRDQELAYKETFTTGTSAAVAGGVTTILDMPNNRPPTNTAARLSQRVELAQGQILCNVGFYAAPSRNNTENIRMLKAGIVGFKVNMLKPIGDSLSDSEIVAALGGLVRENAVAAFHAEDGSMVNALEENCRRHGRRTYDDFLLAHTSACEETAVLRALALTRQSACNGHIAHLSCTSSLVRIRRARLIDRAPITCEVTPHHLLLDGSAIEKTDGLAIMTPPLRRREDRLGLWKGLVEGEIDVCATDHAPHTWSEKTAQDVWEVAPGVSNLDVFMPLLLTEAFKDRIGLRRLTEATSKIPARLFGISARGVLAPGFYADLILVDHKVNRRLRGAEFQSKAKFTPFEGRRLSASIALTFVNGICVWQENQVIGSVGSGKVIRRSSDGREVRPRRHAG